MKVGALCAGYGGIEMGLRLAGVPVDLRWLAELEPKLDPIHPVGVPNLGDLTAIDWTTGVEPVDMVTAGFPCQPVSAAGAQQAQADPRWLWPAVRDCLAALLPQQFLLENVRNLVSIQRGAIWAGILADLNALGYDVRWLTLGACHVGAAHHRHRVFALATRGAGSVEHVATSPCGAKDVNVPTPTSYGSNQGGAAGRIGPVRHSLDSMARFDLLPTPAARDGAKGGGDGTQAQQTRDRNSVTLDVVAGLFPSPQARDGQGRGTPSADTATGRYDSGRRNLDDALSLLPTPTASERTGADASPKEGTQNLRTAVSLLPTPRASVDAVGGPGQRGSSGDLAMPSAVRLGRCRGWPDTPRTSAHPLHRPSRTATGRRAWPPLSPNGSCASRPGTDVPGCRATPH